MNLAEIQEQLREQGLSGWLFFDHHYRDPIAYRVLGLPDNLHVSRRWYYWIPAEGDPQRLVHRIEGKVIDALPGGKRTYSSWPEQREQLAEILSGAQRVAMQYSPDCMIPYVSLVDAGTVELVRGICGSVESSAALVQYFEARWTAEQRASHAEASAAVDGVRAAAFDLIGTGLRRGETVTEWQIASFILERFRAANLFTDSGPIVGVNANAADPHYTPSAQRSAPIVPGDWVLIDLWAKCDRPGAVYYDITWTGYAGTRVPERMQEVFEVVTGARDTALQTVDEAVREGRTLCGWEVDDVTRNSISARGFGDAFVHRTGHSIGEEIHGNGANLDNLETRDDRPLVANTCFSIEPGVYLEDFGVRSEIDCFLTETGAEATGEVQREVVRIETP